MNNSVASSRSGRGTRRPRILIDVRQRHATNNPYIAQLVKSLRRENSVRYFSWAKAVFGRYDLIHFNWPEHVIKHHILSVRIVNIIAAIVFLTRLMILRTPLILTVHNRKPHDGLSYFEQTFINQVQKRCACRVYMNSDETSVNPPSVVIPHGHYKDWHKIDPTLFIQPKEQILNFGLIKPYKGLEGLVQAFVESHLPRLCVLGRASDPSYITALRQIASGDPRVEIRDRYLPDVELAEVVQSSMLVVLPYEDFYNSGALVMSLSLGVPVALPENRYTKAWRDEVGESWIYLYSGVLRSEVLTEAYRWARSRARLDPPEMRNRDWFEVARLYTRVYEDVLYRSAQPSSS